MHARVGRPRGQANGSLANGGSKRAAERFGKPNANVAFERWHHNASLSIWGRTVNDRSSVSRIALPKRRKIGRLSGWRGVRGNEMNCKLPVQL